MRIEIGQGVVGRSVAENRALISANAQVDDRVDRAADEASGFVTRSLVCVPLATARGPIGALEVVNKRDGSVFGPADAEILRLVAAPTALAINNARMAHELIEQVRLKRSSTSPAGCRNRCCRSAGAMPSRCSASTCRHTRFPATSTIISTCPTVASGSSSATFPARSRCRPADGARRLAAALDRQDGTPPANGWPRQRRPLPHRARRPFRLRPGRPDGTRWRQRALRRCRFPPALLIRRGFHRVPFRRPPLGIPPGIPFEPHALELGDGTLYCFSDRSPTCDAARRTIGEQGVRELVTRHAGSSSGRACAPCSAGEAHAPGRRHHPAAGRRPSSRSHEVLLEAAFRRARKRCASWAACAGRSMGPASSPACAIASCLPSTRPAQHHRMPMAMPVRATSTCVLSEGNQFEFRLLDTAPVATRPASSRSRSARNGQGTRCRPDRCGDGRMEPAGASRRTRQPARHAQARRGAQPVGG